MLLNVTHHDDLVAYIDATTDEVDEVEFKGEQRVSVEHGSNKRPQLAICITRQAQSRRWNSTATSFDSRSCTAIASLRGQSSAISIMSQNRLANRPKSVETIVTEAQDFDHQSEYPLRIALRTAQNILNQVRPYDFW